MITHFRTKNVPVYRYCRVSPITQSSNATHSRRGCSTEINSGIGTYITSQDGLEMMKKMMTLCCFLVHFALIRTIAVKLDVVGDLSSQNIPIDEYSLRPLDECGVWINHYTSFHRMSVSKEIHPKVIVSVSLFTGHCFACLLVRFFNVLFCSKQVWLTG